MRKRGYHESRWRIAGFLASRLGILAAILLFCALSIPALAEDESWDVRTEKEVDVGLDPGHSFADVGAVGGGVKEYEITLPIAMRVKELLEEQGLTVALSRQDEYPLTDFSDPDPTERIRIEQEARIAAVGKARAYISIHFNGYGDPRVRGAETYYNGDNHGRDSLLLARAIQSALIAEVSYTTGYPLPNRGVKEDLWAGKPYGHFFSLRGDMPSALVEAMFLSNPREAALMAKGEAREAVAKGIAAGILEYFQLVEMAR